MPHLRYGARGVIVDPADRLFLLHCVLPHLDFWLTPGGGIEPGETTSAALRRELREEVGLSAVKIEQHLWHQYVLGNYATGYDGVVNDYYLVRVAEPFTPCEAELLVENVVGYNWWTLDDLLATSQEFSPQGLPALFEELLHDGPPAEVRTIGL